MKVTFEELKDILQEPPERLSAHQLQQQVMKKIRRGVTDTSQGRISKRTGEQLDDERVVEGIIKVAQSNLQKYVQHTVGQVVDVPVPQI